ncbi:MAG TPA: DUF4126 domain-containing protein [Candidatus Polarisedimenticolia bacterium]|nr:DUF4126 domain-containing protein [Candidatus Polarisedimenticolia bacterium]
MVSIALGLSLSAACGFRVFVPLLAIGAAARLELVELSPGFSWMGATPTLIAFGTATLLEVAAYYIPWLDNFLDAAATPAAIIAGILASAAVFVDMPPLVRWVVALVGGGGAAGLIQGATVLLRIKSLATTGGLGNPVVSTAELAGSTVVSVLAIFVPIFCLVLLLVGTILVFRSAGRIFFGRTPAS